MEQQEHRKYKRIPYNETLLVNNSLEVICHDISEGGLFIQLNRSLLPGSIVSITFSGKVKKFMAVVQAVPETGGLGLMFTDMDEVRKAEMRELLEMAETANSLKGTKPLVLMVEDSSSVRKMNKTLLIREGFSVLEAADGMDALRLLGTEKPNVVLLDLHMEKMDGYKVLAYLKQNEKLKDIPVIVFSSKFSSEEQERVYDAGAAEFLPKMTTPPNKLLGIIKNLIED